MPFRCSYSRHLCIACGGGNTSVGSLGLGVEDVTVWGSGYQPWCRRPYLELLAGLGSTTIISKKGLQRILLSPSRDTWCHTSSSTACSPPSLTTSMFLSPSCHRRNPQLHPEKPTSGCCPEPQLRLAGDTSPAGAQGWSREYGLQGQHQSHSSAVQSHQEEQSEGAEAGQGGLDCH